MSALGWFLLGGVTVLVLAFVVAVVLFVRVARKEFTDKKKPTKETPAEVHTEVHDLLKEAASDGTIGCALMAIQHSDGKQVAITFVGDATAADGWRLVKHLSDTVDKAFPSKASGGPNA